MFITKQTKFIIAIVIQLIIIFGIIFFKMAILIGGNEVFLRVEQVDPRDLLRGDYVDLYYPDISHLSSDLFGSYSLIKEGDTVYVPLVKDGKYWIVDSYSKIEETRLVNKNQIFIKGKVARFLGSKVDVIYGIEQYFIPEGIGQPSIWGKELAAKVIIDENGNAVLKKLYVNNEPWP